MKILAFAVLSTLGDATSSFLSGVETYTTNQICMRRFCINPIFPGLESLGALSQTSWVAGTLREVRPHLRFCRAAVDYDPALPDPAVQNGGHGASFETVISENDDAAVTMFMYHLAGMGIDGWEYPKPEFADDCVRSVWKMVCYSYFPRAENGVSDGQPSQYMRPCRSSCDNYVRACNVECCDESVQCEFEHSVTIPGAVIHTSGYAPHDAPSSLCTGGSPRSSQASQALLFALVLSQLLGFGSAASLGFQYAVHSAVIRRALWMGALSALALSLQGCNEDVPMHHVGNWRKEDDFLIEFEFIPPGGSTRDAAINSCSLDRLSQSLQCSGKGVCKLWNSDALNNPISFCQCDTDWADPECRTARKSQMYAYLLSLFFGFFGADHFYMGHWLTGTFKLITLGGFGSWWAFDVIRIGTAPVDAARFRVAQDLPHVAFVLMTVGFGLSVGLAVVYYTTGEYRRRKRRFALQMQNDEETPLKHENAKTSVFQSQQSFGSGPPAKRITT